MLMVCLNRLRKAMDWRWKRLRVGSSRICLFAVFVKVVGISSQSLFTAESIALQSITNIQVFRSKYTQTLKVMPKLNARYSIALLDSSEAGDAVGAPKGDSSCGSVEALACKQKAVVQATARNRS